MKTERKERAERAEETESEEPSSDYDEKDGAGYVDAEEDHNDRIKETDPEENEQEFDDEEISTIYEEVPKEVRKDLSENGS